MQRANETPYVVLISFAVQSTKRSPTGLRFVQHVSIFSYLPMRNRSFLKLVQEPRFNFAPGRENRESVACYRLKDSSSARKER
jgi:hypothetical protein